MKKALLAVALAVVLATAILAVFRIDLDAEVLKITGFAVASANGISDSRLTPADRVAEEWIRASSDAVLIRLPNATIGAISETNSMGGLLGNGSSAIMIKPKSAEDLRQGDIVAYHSDEAAGLVAHRIIRIGEDEQGWFAITKGDESGAVDPEKIRFNQARYVIVGIIY